MDQKFASMRQAAWIFPVRETLEAMGKWTGVASSPLIAEGAIFFGGLDGKLYALNLSPEG